MQNLFKLVLFAAPAAAIVLALAFFMNREQVAEMKADALAFDAEFARTQARTTNDKEEKKDYLKRAQALQARYSCAQAVADQKNRQMEQSEQQIRGSIEGSEQQIIQELKKKGH